MSLRKTKDTSGENQTVKKILFWIKKMVNGNVRYCKCFCPTCPYYNKCKNDGVMN